MCDSQIDCANLLINEIYTVKIIIILLFIIILLRYTLKLYLVKRQGVEYQTIRMSDLVGP